MGGSRRAGTDIVCPSCRKKTHVPEHGQESSAQSTHDGSNSNGHAHYNPTHHHVAPEHIPRNISLSVGRLAWLLGAALIVFAVGGYLTFNPGPFNPGREFPGKHIVPATFKGNAAPPVEGKDWKSPLTGMEFVWVPALNVWVGKFEVTNDEYLDKVPEHDSRGYETYTLNGDRQPVVYISFEDARDYARWLTSQERSILAGFRYRLPVDREWYEYARCGRDWSFPWGSNWPPESGAAGNYHGDEGVGAWPRLGGYNDGQPVTCDVDASWVNPWGIYGVGGNVWEACASNTGEQPFSCWLGGAWNNCIPERLHITNRMDVVGEPSLNQGFRLVVSR